MINDRIRARVLNLEDDVVTLGVYVQGAWHRIRARTAVPLHIGAWIIGDLFVPPDGSLVIFKVVDPGTPPENNHLAPPSSGLDLEA